MRNLKIVSAIALVIYGLSYQAIGGNRWYFSPPPGGVYTGPGSALTYGKTPSESYGKIFVLYIDYYTHLYRFFTAETYIEGPTIYLPWKELQPPPSEITPQSDAAICYFYNPYVTPTEAEKVLAVFGGGRDIWTYDVLSDTWTREISIPGNDAVGPGGSMEFGGFREKSGGLFATFFLIKGGGSKEFMVYNRYTGAQVNRPSPIPIWEFLAPFYGNQGFYAGADLAMYHPDPYQLPAPDTIFAMRGNGKPFGLYRISTNQWDIRDSILGDGAFLGGALVSHPKGSTIRDDDEPSGNDSMDEGISILHCFRGKNSNGYSTNEFDCYDVSQTNPDGRWNSDPSNPTYSVGSGSDLVFGGIWYRYQGNVRYKDCIWAIFGDGNGTIGIRYRGRWEYEEGAQSKWTTGAKGDKVKVSPNPAHPHVLFEVDFKSDGRVMVYSGNGQLVRCLSLINGRAIWDLKDTEGKKVTTGIYFYRLPTGVKKQKAR